MPGKVSFKFTPAKVTHEVPAWMWDKQPLMAEIGVETLEHVFGPAGDLTPEQVIEKHRPALQSIAQRKVQGYLERPVKPVLLSTDDFSL